MRTPSQILKSIAGLALCSAMLVAASANAQDDAPARDAAKHFQRGVGLYGDTDYRAALVEFKRAYAIAPNVAVLFNIGEAQYQLQDYASALISFGHYLTQAPAADGRRAEVESAVEVLRARVGRLTITTTPRGADVAIDDQPAGTTPLEESVLVSVGHRKVVASMVGRPQIVRYVDVAAEDNVTVSLVLPSPISAPSAARPALDPLSADASGPSRSGAIWRTAGWVTTGTIAAGAIGFGALALKSSSDLSAARATYPTTAETLTKDANLVKTYSLLADSLTAAAIVVGGVTLYSTLTSGSSGPKERSAAAKARVWLGPTSAHFDMTF